MPAELAEIFVRHAVPFLLVFSRIAGLFMAAPILSSTGIPLRAKALVTLMLSAALYPMVPAVVSGEAVRDVFALLPLVITEGLIGLSIGLIGAIPLMAVEMSGVIAGQSIGFGLARVYNPELDTDSDLIGQLLYYVAIGAFLTLGGLETLVGTLLSTFRGVPLGGFSTDMLPLDMLVGVIAGGIELALRVAMPVVGSTLLLVILLGVVGKTMPQINIMSVGFTIKVLAGLAAIMFALGAVREAVGDQIDQVLQDLIRWAGSLQAFVRMPGVVHG